MRESNENGSRTTKIFCASLLMLGMGLSGYAQQRMVKGVVTDEADAPIPGVTIMLKGTKSGTVTNADGSFSIDAPAGSTLVFSYIGMSKKEVKVGKASRVNVVLAEDATDLNEVVVVGYGQQKKISMTGSVAAVSAKEISKVSTSNVSQALVGKLPGLITQQSGGRPGADAVSLLIRGYSSYNDSGSVLTIIDGVDRGTSGLNWLDPNDIESITVLKDAASCAIYGMKASNGVIIVTTKKGSEGKATISYNGSLTLSHATSLPKMMNGTQYMQYYNLARSLDGLDPYYTEEEIAATYNGDPSDGYENTDWTSPYYKTTYTQKHNVSVSGGTQRTKYYMSGGFMDQDGILDNQYYQRGTFRSNIDTKINNYLDATFNVGGLVTNSNYPTGQAITSGVGGYDFENVMLYSIPFVPKTYSGEMYGTQDEYIGTATTAFRNLAHNPEYASSTGSSGFQKTKRVKMETAGRIDYNAPFLKGLKVSMFASWDWADIDSKTFAYAYKVMAYNPGTKRYSYSNCINLLEGGNMYVGDEKSQQIVLRPSVNYANKFGKHDIAATFLYESTRIRSSKLTGSRTDFELFDLPELSFGTNINASSGNSGSSGKSASAGYAGRINYNYDSKYLAEFSARYDGSYLFAPGKRWGFFPSASLGWVMSNESWFHDAAPYIDLFKVRGSIGLTGNDNVTAWLYRKSYAFAGYTSAFGETPTAVSTLYQTTKYPQSDLTWEKTLSYNLGADLTMWNGLLGIEADVFYKYTYDILQSVSGAYATSLAGNYPSIDNTGRFDNRGFELVVRHTNRINNFIYNINGNLTYAHNRYLRLTESTNTLPWQSKLGTSMGDVWGLKAIGLYQTQEQLDNAPSPISTTPHLGDIMYEDVNGDGKISSDDYVKIGHASRPEMMFALNLSGSWKGFDLSLQFQGAAMVKKMLGSGTSDFSPLTRPWYGGSDNSPLYLVEDSWRPDNTNARYPRLSTLSCSNNAYISSWWMVNGSYLRLKNASLGYTVPTKFTKKVGISNLRVYASGYNLLTWTAFKYLDPELADYAWTYYPQQRTFTFGLDLSF
jgi:TonB-linked SusC/RagA family outer membrane protein